MAVFLLLACQPVCGAPDPQAIAYHTKGKKRVHIDGCRRLTDDPDERAKMIKMTLAEAREKGLRLCSRCPGSETAGKGTAKGRKGLPESWVKPAPDKVEKQKFKPSTHAPVVSLSRDGKLRYASYSERGDRVLDWSFCGYHQNERPLPEVEAVERINPARGRAEKSGNHAYATGADNSGAIQAAIDRVGALPPDERGLRGAVLLRKGTHYISKGLRIPAGVVLRGEGAGKHGTVIIANRPERGGSIIEMTGQRGFQHSRAAEAVRIEDAYVPSGACSFRVANPRPFKEGDFICIRKTVNRQWIDDLGMGERLRHIRGGREGQKKRPWKPKSYQFRIIRRIEKIEGDRLSLDVMLPQSIDVRHGGGEVYPVGVKGVASEAGVESLRLVSNYDTTVKDTGKSADFGNFRNGITVTKLRNGWVKNCTVEHVSFAAVNLGRDTLQITVRDCKNLRPVGPRRGGFRYPFYVGGGTLHLFYRCYSEDGRHDFVGGSRVQGPFAFVNCVAIRGGQSEPHHRWGTGFLFDSIKTRDGVLAAINRGDSGSGHGWSSANTMIWNGDAKNIVVFDPETGGENNFAIGYGGERKREYNTRGLEYANTRAGYWGTPQEGKYFGYALMGNGHIESPDREAKPKSLFIQQLIDRIGGKAAREVMK